MADLMTGKTTYRKLVDEYANFLVPTVKLKVNGLDVVKTLSLFILEMKASLSVDTAGSVIIKFVRLYDESSHSFDAKVKAIFKLGTVVELEVGYLSSTRKIFKGYVEMVGLQMGDQNIYVITLMDVKRLMMVSGRKNVLYDVKNYSDAFKQVMGDYSAVCKTKIENTNDRLESPISQMSNDYDFVMNDLIRKGRVNREFIVFAGTAYFREPRSVSAPIMKLRYGRELTEFSVFHTYKNMSIEVIGVDENENPVVGKAKVKSALSQSPVSLTTPVYTIADSHVITKDRAKIVAEGIAEKESRRICIGRGQTIGLPEIVPGRYIEIENIDSNFNKSYYITDVVHEYTRENFITQFEIGGCD